MTHLKSQVITAQIANILRVCVCVCVECAHSANSFYRYFPFILIFRYVACGRRRSRREIRFRWKFIVKVTWLTYVCKISCGSLVSSDAVDSIHKSWCAISASMSKHAISLISSIWRLRWHRQTGGADILTGNIFFSSSSSSFISIFSSRMISHEMDKYLQTWVTMIIV